MLFDPAKKISHLLSHQFKQKSGGRRECCQPQQPPRRDRTPELFQREIRTGAQKADNYNVALGLFRWCARGLFVLPSGEIQQNTLGTAECQSPR